MKYDVYGIGNALVDMEFKVKDEFFAQYNVDKGLMTLVEEHRQVELLDALHQHHNAEIKRQCGGSAANTMIAVSQLGGSSFYSCKVAKDDAGEFYLSDLKENGVDTQYSDDNLPAGTTGKCMVMVTDDAERTMNTYLGITATFSEDELDEKALSQSKWLYVEGYLVASPTGQRAAVKAVELARKHGVKIALTFSDPGIVKHFRYNFKEIIGDGVDLLFMNEAEALEYCETSDLAHAREELKKIAPLFAVTLGKNGATLWDGTMFIDIEPHQVDAVDTNGAGDMYAGALLYGITNGHSMAGAGALASLASSKVVSQYGPRLSWSQVKEVLKKHTEANL